MYNEYKIKKIDDSRGHGGITIVEAELKVKKTLWEYLTKPSEKVYFELLFHGIIYQDAKDAYKTGSTWKVDLDCFSKQKRKDGRVVFHEYAIYGELEGASKSYKLRPESDYFEDDTLYKIRSMRNKSIHSYFDPDEYLRVFRLPNELLLRPFDMRFIELDVISLGTMAHDSEKKNIYQHSPETTYKIIFGRIWLILF